MKAWRLEKLGGRLTFEDIPTPKLREGAVLVRIEASALMSYLKAYVEGKLPFYNPPNRPFTIGTNAVGTIEAIGSGVFKLKPGQRVIVSSHLAARENVDDPSQILIGLTASPDAAPMLAEWGDGMLAEYALVPAETVTPLEGLESRDAAELVAMSRFIVPYGGLLRGRLSAGETLVVNGATGAYGGAAVLLGLAMGAARVVAVGRDATALARLAEVAGPRLATVPLTGDAKADAATIRTASGGAHMAFDMVGGASDPRSTLAALTSLRRGGRLVLMGSMTVDLPIPYTMAMLNDWEILGHFMYPANAYRRLAALVRAGLLDLGKLTPRTYPLAELRDAMEAAAEASSLDYVVAKP